MNWFKSFWKRLTTPLPDTPPGAVRPGNGSAAGTPVEPARDHSIRFTEPEEKPAPESDD